MEPLSGDPRTWPVAPPGSPFHVPSLPTRVLRRRLVLAAVTFLPLPAAVVVILVQRRWLEAGILLLVVVPYGWLHWVRVRGGLAELRRRAAGPAPDASEPPG